MLCKYRFHHVRVALYDKNQTGLDKKNGSQVAAGLSRPTGFIIFNSGKFHLQVATLELGRRGFRGTRAFGGRASTAGSVVRTGHCPRDLRGPGRSLSLGEDATKAKTNKVKANMAAHRISANKADEFVSYFSYRVLSTWNRDAASTSVPDRARLEIETLSMALKSRGYDLKVSYLTDFDRMQQLIGLLALTFTWTHIVGEQRGTGGRASAEKAPWMPRVEPLSVRVGLLQSVLVS